MVSVMLYPCILWVALLMDLFVLRIVSPNICFGVVAILLLNVMQVFSVGGGALLYDLPNNVCVLCP